MRGKFLAASDICRSAQGHYGAREKFQFFSSQSAGEGEEMISLILGGTPPFSVIKSRCPEIKKVQGWVENPQEVYLSLAPEAMFWEEQGATPEAIEAVLGWANDAQWNSLFIRVGGKDYSITRENFAQILKVVRMKNSRWPESLPSDVSIGDVLLLSYLLNREYLEKIFKDMPMGFGEFGRILNFFPKTRERLCQKYQEQKDALETAGGRQYKLEEELKEANEKIEKLRMVIKEGVKKIAGTKKWIKSKSLSRIRVELEKAIGE